MGSILREKLPTMIKGLQTPQKAVNNHAFSFLIVIFLDELTFRRRWLLTFFRLPCSRYHACCLLLLLFVHSGDTGYRLGSVFTYFLCSFFTSEFVYTIKIDAFLSQGGIKINLRNWKVSLMNVWAWLRSFSFISFVKASFYKARSFINLRIHCIISTYLVLTLIAANWFQWN